MEGIYLSLRLFLSKIDPFSWPQKISLLGKNLEYGLKQEGLLSFVRELNGNEEENYENYLRDASMYARGDYRIIIIWFYQRLIFCITNKQKQW